MMGDHKITSLFPTRRVDELLVTEAWDKQKGIAAREGVVAIAYERKYGQYSRIYQMAKLMLWTSGSGLYSCPIAMTGKRTTSPPFFFVGNIAIHDLLIYQRLLSNFRWLCSCY